MEGKCCQTFVRIHPEAGEVLQQHQNLVHFCFLFFGAAAAAAAGAFGDTV